VVKVVCIKIPDEKVWTEFQVYVARKYGHVKGNLGVEVAKALREYLNRAAGELRAHTNSEGGGGQQREYKSSSPTMKRLREITSRILQISDNEIAQTTVEKIIAEEAGGERRTLEKYVVMLKEYGILKPVKRIQQIDEKTGAPKPIEPPKFIFEVNLDEAKKLVRIS